MIHRTEAGHIPYSAMPPTLAKGLVAVLLVGCG